MSSPHLNKPRRAGRPCAAVALASLALIGMGMAGCRSAPPLSGAAAQPVGPAVHPAPAAAAATPVNGAPAGASATSATNASPAAGAAAGGASAAPLHPDIPPAARADFDRAVNFMRAGNASEAELGFKQVALQYPQFAAPLVNLAILQRKQGHLDQAELSLKSAVEHESGSAVAWTELGVTQRIRGEFKEAASSYEQAITADPHYAPAWRNLGVVSDLYLGDPQRALKAFEQYKQLTGEDKPVSGWIAELRQRLGLPGVKHPAEDSAPGGSPTPPATPGDTTPPAPAPQQGQGAANAAGAPAAASGG
jgi:tetratricopeptide (TPR) repeat protein